MAAPLKIHAMLGQRVAVRSCLCGTRSMSSFRDNREDGPPPWAASPIPSGKTFYAIQLAKMQNRELWHRRMDYVNRPWKNLVKDYKKNIGEIEIPCSERPMLLMVKRVAPTTGEAKKFRDLVSQLGLDERYEPKIIKNSESLTKMLQKINHLIEVYPVRFPYGLPESAEDLDHCYLTDDGQFIVKKKLRTEKQIEEVTDELPKSEYDMTQEHIDKRLELRKMKYQIAQEYFQTKYVFEQNQDRKEWRYKGDQRLGYDKIWH